MGKVVFTCYSVLILALLAGCESVSNEIAAESQTNSESSELKAGRTALTWMNPYRGPLSFKCPGTQSISFIQSVYSKQVKDRQWRFGCQGSYSVWPKCFWTGFVNNCKQNVRYSCPANHVLTGISNKYNKWQQDRRWRFKCCKVKRFCYSRCYWTSYINHYEKGSEWRVPGQSYLVGVESLWNPKFVDHRWKYKYCIISAC